MVLCPVPYVMAGMWVWRKIPVWWETPRGKLVIAGIGLSATALGYAILRQLQQARAIKRHRLPVGLDKRRFGLSELGFVPHPSEVLRRLPGTFEVWEACADRLPALRASREIAADVNAWPLIDVEPLLADAFSPALRRAHAVLTMVAQAYIWCDPATPAEALPAALAVPLHAVSARLGLPPTMTHASCQLWNWYRADGLDDAGAGAVTQDSLRCATTITGLVDEEWFHCTSIAVQMIAGPSVLASYDVLAESAPTRDVEALLDFLESLAKRLEDMAGTLKRLDQRCAPEAFWRQMRPVLQGPSGAQSQCLVYQGVSALGGKSQGLSGASAAQSSAIPVFDAVLGVRHHEPTARFARDMLRYMPGPHREFVELMQAQRPLRETILQWRSSGEPSSEVLVGRFNVCLDRLADFRRVHWKLVGTHIVAMKVRDAASEQKIVGADYGAKYADLGAYGSSMDALLNGTLKSTLDAKI